jgi:anti-sigma factor RsiW
MNSPELTCQELVELVTEYLEGTLAPGDSERFEAHLADCEGCENYVLQMRKTVELVGALREDHLEPDTRDALLRAFRGFTRADSPR